MKRRSLRRSGSSRNPAATPFRAPGSASLFSSVAGPGLSPPATLPLSRHSSVLKPQTEMREARARADACGNGFSRLHLSSASFPAGACGFAVPPVDPASPPPPTGLHNGPQYWQLLMHRRQTVSCTGLRRPNICKIQARETGARFPSRLLT